MKVLSLFDIEDFDQKDNRALFHALRLWLVPNVKFISHFNHVDCRDYLHFKTIIGQILTMTF